MLTIIGGRPAGRLDGRLDGRLERRLEGYYRMIDYVKNDQLWYFICLLSIKNINYVLMNKLESLTTTFFLYGKHLVVLGSMQHSAVRTNFTYNNHDDIQVLFYFIVTLQQ